MKLLILSGNFPFGMDGDNNFLQNEMRALSQTFEKVTVIATSDGVIRNDLPPNFKALSVPPKINLIRMLGALCLSLGKQAKLANRELQTLCPHSSRTKRFLQICKYNYMYLTLRKTLIRECKDVDLVYSYWLSSRAYAVARLKNKCEINCPIVSRAHRFDLYLECDDCLPFRKFIGNTLAAIYFISENGKQYYQENFKDLIDSMPDLQVYYLGLDKTSTNNEYVGSSILRLVTCSSIISVKRLDIMIDALSAIDDIAIDWVHFGSGVLEQFICQMAREKLDSKSNISYRFMGACRNQDIQKYYSEHEIDLLINCSDSEGVPVSMMEAFSFGIPVMCRDTGGNAEINRGDKDYLLPKSAEGKEFAQAMRVYYNKTIEEKKERRNAVREIFDKYFSRNTIESFMSDLTRRI